VKSRLALCAILFVGCGSDDASQQKAAPRFESPGPHAVGHVRFDLVDASRARSLSVTAWYPAESASGAKAPIDSLLAEGADRDAYAALVAAAPEDCATRSVGSAPSPARSTESSTWPLVVFSHCHNCLGLSAASIAERLASYGFVVAAPDHAENTLFDKIAGTAVGLSKEFLQTRALDVRFVLDTLLEPSAQDVPDALRGAGDATRVGVFGHSFGGVTTGLVLQDDPRPLAGVSIAAPMENPLLPGVSMTQIDKPVLFLLAQEDNSIGEIGNDILRSNFDDGNPPLVKVEVADAGHWSFSDICGLTSDSGAGCGEAQRQTDTSETFRYLPVRDGIALASAYVTAFFSAELRADDAGRAYVRGAHPEKLTSVAARE
jgi:dienelactone hydrolase